MLRIGILEDEKAHSDELIRFLERYRSEHGSFSYSVKVYDAGRKLLFDYKQDCDLIFLDIRLPDMLGIDAAREIRKIDHNVMIVFVTSLTQYAFDGYTENKVLLWNDETQRKIECLEVLPTGLPDEEPLSVKQ